MLSSPPTTMPCTAFASAAAALPSDARRGDDDGCPADAEDFARSARHRYREELGHGQSALRCVGWAFGGAWRLCGVPVPSRGSGEGKGGPIVAVRMWL